MAKIVLNNRLDRLVDKLNVSIRNWQRNVSWHIGGHRFFRKYATEIIRAHKWCFIGGCNNSGTTLLKNLLRDTGQVSAFASEGQIYTNALVKANRSGYERVWTEYIEDVRLTSKDNGIDMPRLLHDWMREIESPCKEMILEKTTLNAVRMPWLQSKFLHSYFIGLVRNGYAVSEGIRRRGKKSIERGARHWAEVNKIMLEDSKQLNRYLEVRYEDLAKDPASVLSRVLQFLGLQNELIPRVQRRIATVEDQNSRSIGRLTEFDRIAIEKEAGNMLEFFGYFPNKIDPSSNNGI